MLPRVLEPEVMDSPEEARDYDAMDHGTVNGVFVSDFLAVWDGRSPVLDVGTGTAQIPIELCRRAAAARVVAIDLAEHMLSLAENNIFRAGLGTRVRVERRDAKSLPYADGTFGAVMSNSIVHHIPEPQPALAEMLRMVGPGGTVFVRDLVRPPDDETVGQLVAMYAGANAHQQQMFGDSLRAALTLTEMGDMVANLGYDPRTVQRTTDRHWTWHIKKKVVD